MVRTIPDAGFPGDDGSTPTELAAALAAYGADPARRLHALARVSRSRLLVPVVALLGELEHQPGQPAREKTSDMASVLMRGRDGRLALLAFTGIDSLARWDPAARPVPVWPRTAALAALQDRAEALVVDVAGPVPLVVAGADLRSLAGGEQLVEMGGRHAWVAPARLEEPDAGRTGPV